MYDDNPLKQTPFFKEITGLDQTTLILNKWSYNPKTKLMEVMFETNHTGTDTVKPTFAFAAKASKSLESYPVKIVYEQDNQYVVHIQNVPEKYKVIGLFVKEIRDQKLLESEARDKLIAEKGSQTATDKLDIPKPKEKILVGDYRKISVNPSLKKQSNVDYQIAFVELEMKQIAKQIMTLEKDQLPLQDEIIKNIRGEIQQLESELVYKTEAEKQDVRRQIAQKETSIEKIKEKQQHYKERIQELQNKHEKLIEKIEIIRSGGKKKNAIEDKSA